MCVALLLLDVTPPDISCTTDKQAYTTANMSSASVTWAAPNATDNVGVASLACTPQIGASLFPVGLTTVNCTATDLTGNAASCSFNVTVTDKQV